MHSCRARNSVYGQPIFSLVVFNRLAGVRSVYTINYETWFGVMLVQLLLEGGDP